MIREKGKRRGEADETMVMHQVKGEVEEIVAIRVPIEVDKIFDSGLFDEERQVILVEGPPGGGKTSLTYHYSQEWAAGNLSMFDVVAVVYLRTLDDIQASTVPDLLLLACANVNDEEITRDLIRRYVMKCPRLLLVLDGWDEAPNQLRKPSFVTEILQSIMPQSKILITSRPESSVDLHCLANRIEIVGFIKECIYEYFQKALSTELDHDKVEDGCRKLREHFRNHPVIQSCCSIPLNAAILAHLLLTDQCLPSTRHELFLMLVLSRINRELQERYSHGNVTVRSIDNLPHEYKIVLSHICVLAFEGVKQNKVVFPQEELERLKVPLDLPTLGLLQIVKSFGRIGQISYHYFIHLSIQELLAAYHISQLGEDEQVKVFEDLLDEPRFSSVLQFYAAFTRFTNQGVRDIVTRIDLANKQHMHILLTIMRCCFEANSQDQLLFQKIKQRLNGRLWIVAVALTPFDCMSVGYFLAFALRTGELNVTLPSCSIDDHSLGLLLGELSRHAEACSSGDVLQGVTELNIGGNNISDDGMARLATALQANTTMKILDISGNDGIAVNGAKSLGRALSVNSSLEELDISDTSIGDEGVAHIANALQTNTTMKVLNVEHCDISGKGAESLARALTPSSSLEELYISDNKFGDDGLAHIATTLRTNNTLNSFLFNYDGNATDKAALSLAAALTTNTSMKYIRMWWSSTHPDTTLKKVAEYVRKSTLRKLALYMIRPFGEPRMSVEEVIEWLQQVAVGGKEFFLSLEDSHAHLESFSLELVIFESSVRDLQSQVRMSLDGAATSVNMTRKMNNLPEIKFSISIKVNY